MQTEEALKIVRALADGVNPETGEVLPVESVFQRPQSVRALHVAVNGIEYLMERERNRQRLPGNAGKSWSRLEDKQVCEEVQNGMDFHDIAKAHNRTVGSIVARLVKLGKIAPYGSSPKVA